jgi:sugar O-acyltransferase (sialic acid O-acetyltransferase NeuD family)
MKDLIIIGAGDVGGFLALNQNLFEQDYNILGFLDDDPKKQDQLFWQIPVLGKIEDLIKYSGCSVAVGISSPIVKKVILERIGQKYDFPNFISKNSWVSNKVTIGRGVIIYPGVSINYDTIIEDFVIINMNCAIGHSVTIQKCSSLAPGVSFGGFTFVEPYVDIGIGVSTIQKIKIGKEAIIGGQTMLIANVEKETTIVGVPGSPVKKI